MSASLSSCDKDEINIYNTLTNQPDTTSKTIVDTAANNRMNRLVTTVEEQDRKIVELQRQKDSLAGVLEEQGKNLENTAEFSIELWNDYRKLVRDLEQLENKQNKTEEDIAAIDKEENRLEKLINLLNGDSREKMTRADKDAFGWADWYNIYDWDFHTIDNNNVFNAPITKHLMGNIVYRFTDSFGLNTGSGKNSSDFELASWDDLKKELLETYFPMPVDFSKAFETWKYNGNATLHLNELLIFLKYCAEFYDLK